MFKNRRIEMKVVNTKKDPSITTREIPFEVKAVIISDVLHRVVYQIGKAVIAYVTIDTVRKVLIEKAKS